MQKFSGVFFSSVRSFRDEKVFGPRILRRWEIFLKIIFHFVEPIEENVQRIGRDDPIKMKIDDQTNPMEKHRNRRFNSSFVDVEKEKNRWKKKLKENESKRLGMTDRTKIMCENRSTRLEPVETNFCRRNETSNRERTKKLKEKFRNRIVSLSFSFYKRNKSPVDVSNQFFPEENIEKSPERRNPKRENENFRKTKLFFFVFRTVKVKKVKIPVRKIHQTFNFSGKRKINRSDWPRIWPIFELDVWPLPASPTPKTFRIFNRLCKSPQLFFLNEKIVLFCFHRRKSRRKNCPKDISRYLLDVCIERNKSYCFLLIKRSNIELFCRMKNDSSMICLFFFFESMSLV